MVLEQLRDGQDPFHPPISRPTIRFAAPAPRPRRQTVESASVDIAAIIEAIIAALRGVHDRPRIPAGWMVAVDSDKQWLGFTSGHQRVVVYADRIEAGRGDQDEIEVMLERARLRGWQTLAAYFARCRTGFSREAGQHFALMADRVSGEAGQRFS